MTLYVEPKACMVINYGYLWARQAKDGMRELPGGTVERIKFRPSLILAVKEEDNKKVVYVSPITHTPPFYPEESLLMPADTKERLGLDGLNSWLMVSEVNKFEWPGTDIRRVPDRMERSQFYGFVPGKFLEEAHGRLPELLQLKRFKTAAREYTQRPEQPRQPVPKPAPVQAPAARAVG